MASAATPASPSTKETTNYARLCRLLVDVGSQALRDTFDAIHPPVGLHTVLGRHPEHATLKYLKSKRVLNATQWGKLYPAIPSSVSSAGFDITLLMVLLRNICGIAPPSTGWDRLPPSTDLSKQANIARLKYYRNTVCGHASQASLDDVAFNNYWLDISNAIVGMAGACYGAAISKLKIESMDPDTEEHYRQLLKQWKEDEDNVKEKLQEIEASTWNIKKDLNQVRCEVGNIVEKLDTIMARQQETKDRDKVTNDFDWMRTEVGNLRDKLDTLMARQHEAQDQEKMTNDIDQVSSLMMARQEETQHQGDVKNYLDQIKIDFGNMSHRLDDLVAQQRETKQQDGFDPTVIIDNIRQLYKNREGWLAPFPWCEDFHFSFDDIYTRLKVIYRKKTKGTATDRVVTMSEIFNQHEECEEPRVVLIEGKPGMGKTTYCKKVVFDWASGKHATGNCFANIVIVLLIKCRDVQSGLWEAIEDQLLPREVGEDEREKFFDFIRHNQSNVLLVLDGLDEVSEKKLPMFSQIIQGRVLPNCRVVATARHEAGVKVRKYCDTLLEVKGFTRKDVKTFIRNYFKAQQNLAEQLIKHLSGD